MLGRAFSSLSRQNAVKTFHSSSRSTQHVVASTQRARGFHLTSCHRVVKPYLLADIGEGITECQVIRWSVKPGDHVQEFDVICEVQSDKASVEITSRYDGVVKQLHYQEDDMAIVGAPLIDIDVEGEASDEESIDAIGQHENGTERPENGTQSRKAEFPSESSLPSSSPPSEVRSDPARSKDAPDEDSSRKEVNFEATPAIRHMLRQYNLHPQDVRGTGRGGRITKEDILQHTSKAPDAASPDSRPAADKQDEIRTSQQDHLLSFNPVERQMFKTMTRSLTIPHFLYTHAVDVTDLTTLVKTFSADDTSSAVLSANQKDATSVVSRLTILPFIMKALSQVLTGFPKLNAHLDPETNPDRLLLKAKHNFGFAVDTPQGLLVPVVHDIQAHSVVGVAAEIKRLSTLAREGRLEPGDFRDGTFIVSNIGSIGGDVVSPVIVAPMVGILGVGRSHEHLELWAGDGGSEKLVKRRKVVLSWSADHRIVDGATVAKAAEALGALMRRPDSLGLILR